MRGAPRLPAFMKFQTLGCDQHDTRAATSLGMLLLGMLLLLLLLLLLLPLSLSCSEGLTGEAGRLVQRRPAGVPAQDPCCVHYLQCL